MPSTRREAKAGREASRRSHGSLDSAASARTSSARSAPVIARRIGAASGGVEGGRPGLPRRAVRARRPAPPRQARAASNRYRSSAMNRQGPKARAGRGCGPRRGALVALGLALAAHGCARAPEPGASWPPGALVAGRGRALGELLARLARLEGTPLGREARAWAEAL